MDAMWRDTRDGTTLMVWLSTKAEEQRHIQAAIARCQDRFIELVSAIELLAALYVQQEEDTYSKTYLPTATPSINH